MSFDGVVFSKVVYLLKNKIINSKINKIYQLSLTDFAFVLFSKTINTCLVVSVNNTSSYISLDSSISNPKIEQSHFTNTMFYHLVNGKIIDIEQINNDRIVKLTIDKTNEIGISKVSYLYIELTGKLTNMILTKDNNVIIDCLHKIGITASRTIETSGIYMSPLVKKLKNIYNDEYDPLLSIKEQFGGMSINLVNEINYRLENKEAFNDIVNEIKDSNYVYLYPSDFHIIPFKSFNSEYEKMDIFEGINKFYKSKIKEATNNTNSDLIKVVNKQLKHYTSKKTKLENELNKAFDYEKYMEYGDLIFSSQYDLSKSYSEVNILSYSTNSNILIKLDNKISLKENALNFYKKYKKYKNSLIFIKEQIDICIQNIEYFSSLLFQIQNSNNEDIIQIKQELINQKILNISLPKQKSNKEMKLSEYEIDGIKISVGKNNLQNEYLTFKVAKYNDYFFHVQDYSGAHVIVHANQLNEEIIRYAANLASYNSQARYSSSVPVQYTQVKNVKKIPGGKPGKVILKEYKLIYIDPTKI